MSSSPVSSSASASPPSSSKYPPPAGPSRRYTTNQHSSGIIDSRASASTSSNSSGSSVNTFGSKFGGAQRRTHKNKISFPRPMSLALTAHDAARVEKLTLTVVSETLESYEAHRAVDQRRLLSDRWKEIRRHENIAVYKERSGWRAPFQTLRDLDGQLTPVLCKQAPTLLAIGTLQGSLDDEMYGCMAMSDDAARARTAYLGDGVDRFRMLARIREPTERDPFRSVGICYCSQASPYPLVKPRDYCLAMATGMTRTRSGERVGYYLIHSVDMFLPPTEEDEMEGSSSSRHPQFVHAKGSLCWLKIEQPSGKVDLYAKGFFAPMGTAPEFASLAPLVEAVLTTAMTSDTSYAKKLFWMIRDAVGASRQMAELPPMPKECVGRCRTAFGSRKSSSNFRRCIVCKQAVCSSCEVVRKIAVDVEEEERAHQNKCSVCLICMNNAKTAPAAKFALREAHHAAAKNLKASSVSSSSTGSTSGSRWMRGGLEDDRQSNSGVRLTDEHSDSSATNRYFYETR